MEDLILRDVSRCNDVKCPKSVECKRHLQYLIDVEKMDFETPANNFNRAGKESCENFIQANNEYKD